MSRASRLALLLSLSVAPVCLILVFVCGEAASGVNIVHYPFSKVLLTLIGVFACAIAAKQVCPRGDAAMHQSASVSFLAYATFVTPFDAWCDAATLGYIRAFVGVLSLAVCAWFSLLSLDARQEG